MRSNLRLLYKQHGKSCPVAQLPNLVSTHRCIQHNPPLPIHHWPRRRRPGSTRISTLVQPQVPSTNRNLCPLLRHRSDRLPSLLPLHAHHPSPHPRPNPTMLLLPQHQPNLLIRSHDIREHHRLARPLPPQYPHILQRF